jgi:hypothetical protein
LAITYELVNEMGGQLRVKSRVGEGSTFTVVLPMRPQSSEGFETSEDDQQGLEAEAVRRNDDMQPKG